MTDNVFQTLVVQKDTIWECRNIFVLTFQKEKASTIQDNQFSWKNFINSFLSIDTAGGIHN